MGCCFFCLSRRPSQSPFFFFNDTATTEIYTLSLHDALPICPGRLRPGGGGPAVPHAERVLHGRRRAAMMRSDRKSTRLNSSHLVISYAVFCLKKKKQDGRSPTPWLRVPSLAAARLHISAAAR